MPIRARKDVCIYLIPLSFWDEDTPSFFHNRYRRLPLIASMGKNGCTLPHAGLSAITTSRYFTANRVFAHIATEPIVYVGCEYYFIISSTTPTVCVWPKYGKVPLELFDIMSITLSISFFLWFAHLRSVTVLTGVQIKDCEIFGNGPNIG